MPKIPHRVVSVPKWSDMMVSSWFNPGVPGIVLYVCGFYGLAIKKNEQNTFIFFYLFLLQFERIIYVI